MNDQQPKPDPIKYTLKIPVSGSELKAIASFVLGIASVTPLVVYILFSLILSLTGPHVGGFEGPAAVFIFIILPLFILTIIAGPIGLILGIMGLKSTKRNFAIVGIILCIIGLLPVLFFLRIFLF